MRSSKTVGVIIPALNEEKAISKVIQDIPEWVDKILVVDNGSDDNTSRVAEEAGAAVVTEPVKGYGQACLTGLANLENTEIIVFLDGDYSDHADEMHIIVDPVAEGCADLVIGSRTRGDLQKGALTIQQIFGNWLACTLICLFWGYRYTDLGPFRAINAASLKTLAMEDTTYGWTIEMQIKALLHKLEIMEKPVSYRNRIGVSKISGSLKGSIMAGIKILSVIGRFVIRYGFSPLPDRRKAG